MTPQDRATFEEVGAPVCTVQEHGPLVREDQEDEPETP